MAVKKEKTPMVLIKEYFEMTFQEAKEEIRELSKEDREELVDLIKEESV
jgi:hypothetical protein